MFTEHLLHCSCTESREWKECLNAFNELHLHWRWWEETTLIFVFIIHHQNTHINFVKAYINSLSWQTSITWVYLRCFFLSFFDLYSNFSILICLHSWFIISSLLGLWLWVMMMNIYIYQHNALSLRRSI